ncbi:hypothetical protein MUP59_02045 [Candidatus Bathyarchaeota archaeon]|nr:hypothetical protein [Candidatus Bathyarchaeota archaeon]
MSMQGVLGGLVRKAQAAVSDLTGIIITVIGAGSAGAIATVIKSWFPDQTTGQTDEVIAAVAGAAIFYFGEKIHPRLVSFGFGVFLSAIGAFTTSFTSGIIEMLTKK